MAGVRLQSKLIAAALVAGSVGAAQAQEADRTGFYAGVHADYLWGDPTVDSASNFFDEEFDGFAGGVQVGFNYQFDQFLIGIEGDIAAADADGEAFNFKNPAVTEGISVDLDWLATLRARAGFVFENLLVYGTGGFAWGGGDGNLIGFGSLDDVDMNWSGYTVGAGAEYLLSDSVSVKAEYLYVDLGKEDFDPQFNAEGSGLEFSAVRLGVNYNFGMP